MSRTKIYLTFFLLISSILLFANNDTTRVLFIGNSITYFNNMPKMFENIANNLGHNVKVKVHAPGGTGIVNHHVNAALFKTIASKKWDIVVIQPGSSESAGVSFPVKITCQRATILLDSIYKYNPCTKVYLYQIPYGIPTNGGYNKYFQVQTMIKDSVLKMADILHLQMLPAGECARAYYTKSQNLYLHSSMNDIHPNANGSFLVASSFYVGIYQDSSSSCTYYSNLDSDTAKKFFHIADTVVLNRKSDWRINTYNLHSEFSFTQFGDSITTLNKSVNYSSLLWKFGDGNTSTLVSPTHRFYQNGNYSIQLFAYKNSCVDSSHFDINISVGVEEISKQGNQLLIFPNPAKDYIYINYAGKKGALNIYNNLGQKVLQKRNYNKTNTAINISELKRGVYILVLENEMGRNFGRFVRE